MTNSFDDAIVIGSGQAGPALAVRLASTGIRTALIEREHFGGTCVNDGCTPTKAMVASAQCGACRAVPGIRCRSFHDGQRDPHGYAALKPQGE
jgi:pyruvate/2-oxoglutarate dehydrogenase complex dihydrolipoamide dehydrogenase (E3) component